MLKKTMTYVDYNGDSVTEDLYFNLTKAELAKLQVRENGEYIDRVKQLIEQKEVEGIFDFFCSMILDAYGRKSADGRRFYKTAEDRYEFESSIAYSEILAEMLAEPSKMTVFAKAILPADFQDVELDDALPPLEVIDVESTPVSAGD